jgi:hypothetical protein
MSTKSKLAVITLISEEGELRALVRKAVRAGVEMTRHEEETIEQEFIRLSQEHCELRTEFADLERMLDYNTPLDKAVDEQVRQLWDAQAVVELAAGALENEFGHD